MGRCAGLKKMLEKKTTEINLLEEKLQQSALAQGVLLEQKLRHMILRNERIALHDQEIALCDKEIALRDKKIVRLNEKIALYSEQIADLNDKIAKLAGLASISVLMALLMCCLTLALSPG